MTPLQGAFCVPQAQLSHHPALPYSGGNATVAYVIASVVLWAEVFSWSPRLLEAAGR